MPLIFIKIITTSYVSAISHFRQLKALVIHHNDEIPSLYNGNMKFNRYARNAYGIHQSELALGAR